MNLRISDYERARCSLFRKPSFDVEVVRPALERLLVEAWKKNYSAQQAIQEVMGNKEIREALEGQIEEALTFQRQHAEGAIQEYESRAMQTSDLEHNITVQEIERQHAETIKTHAEVLKTAEEGVSSYVEKQTYAQQQVEEMQERIRQRIKELGGDDRVSTIKDIHSMVIGEPSKTTGNKIAAEPATQPKAETSALESKVEGLPEAQAAYAKKRNWLYMFFRNIPYYLTFRRPKYD